MSKPRKARVSVNYAGKNITQQIKSFIKSFTYNDVASGESDSISLELSDIDKKWMGAWLPSKGDRINAKTILYNWDADDTEKVFKCGDFLLDDLSFSGRPLACNIGAVSIPRNEAFNNQQRTKTWEKVTIEEIAKEIAKRANISLYYEASTISIGSIEQNNQTDCKFLYSICQDYGLAMKVYSNKICIFNEESYEKKKAVATISEDKMISWSYNTTITGTYTGATISYTDPTDDKERTVKIGSGSRILEINVSADSTADAEKKGIAKLNNENKKATTMTVTIKANTKIVASCNVQISGLGKLDGKYYVDKVRHRLSGSSSYNMTLTLRLVQNRIKTASIKAVQDATATGNQYTIRSGDSLWSIAKKHLGSGVKYIEIYSLNKDIIESAAKARGKSSSSNGHWLYPGTVITIPSS